MCNGLSNGPSGDLNGPLNMFQMKKNKNNGSQEKSMGLLEKIMGPNFSTNDEV